MNQLDQQALTTHVPILGWLYVAWHALFLLVGIVGLIFMGGIGVLSGDVKATSILVFVGVIGLLFFSMLAIPGLVAGLGLLKRQAWARILAVVIGFLSLAAFPLGTALGIYTFFVLFQDEATAYFGGNQVQGGAA